MPYCRMNENNLRILLSNFKLSVAIDSSRSCMETDSILMSLSTGRPKTINFSFVPNRKLMAFRCPYI